MARPPRTGSRRGPHPGGERPLSPAPGNTRSRSVRAGRRSCRYLHRSCRAGRFPGGGDGGSGVGVTVVVFGTIVDGMVVGGVEPVMIAGAIAITYGVT